jgi:hypothetical protein
MILRVVKTWLFNYMQPDLITHATFTRIASEMIHLSGI